MQAGIPSVTPVILAGGKGTRLASVCPDHQKVVVPVHGRPFITFLLNQLTQAGFREVLLCVGYMADRVAQILGDHQGPLRIRYSRESEPLGTGGAIRQALDHVKTDTVLAMNGDSFVDLDFAEYVAWHAGEKHDASMVVAEVPDTSRYGRVTVGRGGRVVAFEEKGPAGAGWINGGVYQFSCRLLGSVMPPGACSLERDVLPSLVSRGLYACKQQGCFIDIGTPESYARAESVFAARLQQEGGATGG